MKIVMEYNVDQTGLIDIGFVHDTDKDFFI